MRVVAVIPAFNAEQSIGDVVRATRELLPDTVVVNDGSSDDTARQAELAGAEVLSHAANRGKGSALSTACAHVFRRDCDAVVTLDADGQHLPSEIPVLLAAARSGADLVLGARTHRFDDMTALRRQSNVWSSWAISGFAGIGLPDVQTGFRLYSRALYESVGMRGSGFEAESAVVVRAARRGFCIVSVQVALGNPDGLESSSFRPIRDGFRIAGAVIWARLRP